MRKNVINFAFIFTFGHARSQTVTHINVWRRNEVLSDAQRQGPCRHKWMRWCIYRIYCLRKLLNKRQYGIKHYCAEEIIDISVTVEKLKKLNWREIKESDREHWTLVSGEIVNNIDADSVLCLFDASSWYFTSEFHEEFISVLKFNEQSNCI